MHIPFAALPAYSVSVVLPESVILYLTLIYSGRELESATMLRMLELETILSNI